MCFPLPSDVSCYLFFKVFCLSKNLVFKINDFIILPDIIIVFKDVDRWNANVRVFLRF